MQQRQSYNLTRDYNLNTSADRYLESSARAGSYWSSGAIRHGNGRKETRFVVSILIQSNSVSRLGREVDIRCLRAGRKIVVPLERVVDQVKHEHALGLLLEGVLYLELARHLLACALEDHPHLLAVPAVALPAVSLLLHSSQNR
jgi:hypothetical protein